VSMARNLAVLALLGTGAYVAVRAGQAAQPVQDNPVRMRAGLGRGRLMSSGAGQPASRIFNFGVPDFTMPDSDPISFSDPSGLAPPSKKEETIMSSGGGSSGGSDTSFALSGGFSPVDESEANATTLSGSAGYFSPDAPSPNMSTESGAAYAPAPSKKESTINYTPVSYSPVSSSSSSSTLNYTPVSKKEDDSSDSS